MPDRIRLDHDELVCPSCGYSLRGLARDDRIICPECGFQDDLEGIVAANQLPREVPTLLWLLLQFAPTVAVCALTAWGVINSAGPPAMAAGMLILAFPWCAVLSWFGFRAWDLSSRLLITIVGTLGFSFANVVLSGLIVVLIFF